MTTADSAWDALFAALERLRAAWPDAGWTYDRRLKCVVSSIPLAQADAARAAMAETLPTSWSEATLATAPAPIKTLTDACGGLRASQLLFWGGGSEAPGAFGLWWPWGDGTTVSLRIGLHDVDLPKQRYPRLRDVFGIPQAPVAG
jgi:hypothetical protein